MANITKYTGTKEQLENAWKLKKLGVPLSSIAIQVGVDRDVLKFGLKQYADEQIEELGGIDQVRVVENSKLDDIQGILMSSLAKKQQMMKDDILVDDKEIERIINLLLKISERRARLLGTDAPIKHQVNLRVFDQFAAMMIEAIQKHVPPEAQKAINQDIQAALLLAERYRSEDEEES